MFFKRDVLNIFENFTRIHQRWSILNKVKGLQAKNFIKKKLQVFLCEISQIFDIIFFLQNASSGCLWDLVYKTEVLG